ncbi:hypothetical protein LINPERHAP1_LOCUS9215, partial [Linum perenne]
HNNIYACIETSQSSPLANTVILQTISLENSSCVQVWIIFKANKRMRLLLNQ